LQSLPAGLSLTLTTPDRRFPVAPPAAHLKLLRVSGANLASLDELTGLTADSGNIWGSIDDISAVASMGFSTLYMQLPEGKDITPLGELTSLRELDLGQRRPASLAPLCRLANLEKLTLTSAGLKDLTELAGCTALTTLDLRNNGIADISPLRSLTALRTLDVYGNRIADLTPLGALNQLTSLIAAYNGVTTLGAPGSLRQLESLDARGGNLTSLAALNGATKLKDVALADNAIRDISPLADLPDDASVDLSHNSIHDFSPLAAWTGTLKATGQEVALPDATENQPYPVRLLDHRGRPLTPDPHNTATYAGGTLSYRGVGFRQNMFWSGSPMATSPITLTVQQHVVDGKQFVLKTAPAIPWANPRVGQKITLKKAPVWSPEPTSITYRWFRGTSPISGANDSSYTPVAADAGSSLWVQVTAHRPGYADSVVESNYTDNIPYRTLQKTPTPRVTHQGKLTVGTVLTAKPGSWDSGVTLQYQWQRDKKNIPGATGQSYQVTTADAGHKLRVRVTGSKTGYLSKSGYPTVKKYSKQVTPAKAKFAASSKPRITGTRAVGNKLTASVDWAPTATLKYQWYRNGKKINGETKVSYTLKASDLNDRLSVRVTASKPGYTTIAKTSAKTAKIKPGTLVPGSATIEGTAAVGQRLTAGSTGWGPGKVSLSYRWYRDGKAIKGAAAPSYQVKLADADHLLTVRVTGKKPGYTTKTITSAEVAVPIEG
ncbi:MAG: leucine-rich repeat domain-containing protein, partial [Propionibacteriaceae bacterium]|nr:leucine-rich repeat domain-containing protein [Propionibacteriaceae bacterium]